MSSEMIEPKLHNLIEETFQILKDMHPEDGLSSTRDIELVAEINKVAAMMDKKQDGVESKSYTRFVNAYNSNGMDVVMELYPEVFV